MLETSIIEAGDLTSAQHRAAESLVRQAFGAHFRPHDWVHGVDGVHVVVCDDADVVAHASVVPRLLRQGDTELDTGYVEAVAVRADQRGRGLGRVVMDQAEQIIRTRHQIGGLNAVETACAFYAARGWRPWTGPTAANGPAGVIDTYDPADRIFVLPGAGTAPMDPAVALVCDWRVGDLW
ncbi:GNAT family N-acetyltransferase [Mycolicibacterium sp. S2-37]|uniref:GNAT family N-acetyltransferase n=1 Tax=Mycolicibacterium sp. S2-37 TaxID=2810297 RepID=UPI001A953C3A|nr:GNAT family N-acetyltransferase [Mycolicibacterium sp. S2-37]MBO0681027.1 GNAT family N-acetyltransferase [Mycolicibacterium sp. S2-37]